MIQWGRSRRPTPGAATEPVTPPANAAGPSLHAVWEERTRVLLRPVAAPNILALLGYAGASIMVGSWQAGWYGSPRTPQMLFAFVLTFGGLAQFLAGMWSYRARDGAATAMHSMWGAFWAAWGLLFLLVAAGAFPTAAAPRIGAASPAFGFWFLVLAFITATGAVAVFAENMALTAALAVRAAGAGLTAAGFWAGATWPLRTAGWVFVVSAAIAAYTAVALVLQESFGRTVLPLAEHQAAKNIPGRSGVRPVEYARGQAGVKRGQ